MTNPDHAVLIADDDDYFRLALAALLRGPLNVTTVEEAATLDQALSRLADRPGGFSMALFDLSMPGMEGPGTLAAVREFHPGVLVAVVSSSRHRSDILTALETGVHGYIPKAFGPNELVRALKIVMSGDIFVPAFLANVMTVGARSPSNRASADPLINAISRRQRDVLEMLVKGYSNKQIASELSLGEGTVKIHISALLRNLGVSSRAGAAAAGAILLRA